MCVTFVPTVKNDGFQPCLQGNNNLISGIVITSSIILYGETPDERWGGLACINHVIWQGLFLVLYKDGLKGAGMLRVVSAALCCSCSALASLKPIVSRCPHSVT